MEYDTGFGTILYNYVSNLFFDYERFYISFFLSLQALPFLAIPLRYYAVIMSFLPFLSLPSLREFS